MTMFDFTFKRTARLACAVAVGAAALTLVACHSSDDNNGAGATPPAADTPPVATTDSFIASVKALIAVTNETAEPSPIDGVTATAPENTAPESTN
jgi:hypothetical protein